MLNTCTIIARNYLPFATVLVESFQAHHGDGRFTILLVDDEGRDFSPGTPFDRRVTWLRLSDIGLDPLEVRRLAGIYDVTELATAVKPLLLRHLLDDGWQEVIYLDPDIRIFDSLSSIGVLAATHGIVLTPHTTWPYPEDDRDIDAFFVLAVGVYNLGFIAVGESARPFLDWWWERTRREALVDVPKMMFTDQRWVDFVPSFFDHHILKDPGCNVAYWNLHGREVRAEGDRYLVNGDPLKFFHFSGFDSRRSWLLSKHQGARPRVLLSERPAVAQLCREYLTSLEAAGIHDETRPAYGWSVLPSGVPVTSRMRRVYWSALSSAERAGRPEPPVPFDAAAPHAFTDWLNSPTEAGPRRVSRYLYSLYQDRVDLHVHFPDIFGSDAARFNEWAWEHGSALEPIPIELLPVGGPSARLTSLPGRELREGLNVAGYFKAELGIGEAARLLASAIEFGGIPHSTTTCAATLNRQEHPFVERVSDGGAYDINLVCVNADSTPRFARDVGREFFAGRHTAGYWFWEIEQFPDAMRPAFDVVDEVWTATDFIADAVRAANAKPVFTIPLAVPVPRYSPAITRARLGLPEGFVFLLVFDFLSVVERKNPHGVIEAFTSAFANDEGPVLVIKSINGDKRLGELERLRAAASDRSDVRIVDRYYSEEEKNALLGACDCYVSLHRSEGLGLTMAEAMALGKPVVATAYSGNLHFMTPENSLLVDYVRVPVPAGCDPYPTTALWAEPDLGQAAQYLRVVFEQPLEAARRAHKGQQDVMERHNLRTSAQAISERVQAIRHARRSRVTGLPGASDTATTGRLVGPPAPVSVEQLEAMLVPLAETSALRVTADGRSFGSLRIFAQRALFRALRPLWFQQQQFHAHVIATLRLTIDAIRTEQRARETVDARVRELTRKLLTARQETHRLQQLVAGITPTPRNALVDAGQATATDGSTPAIPQADKSSTRSPT